MYTQIINSFRIFQNKKQVKICVLCKNKAFAPVYRETNVSAASKWLSNTCSIYCWREKKREKRVKIRFRTNENKMVHLNTCATLQQLYTACSRKYYKNANNIWFCRTPGTRSRVHDLTYIASPLTICLSFSSRRVASRAVANTR